MSCKEFERRYLGRWENAPVKYQIKAMYSGEVQFEISVDVSGSNYLVIFGEHVNGSFCCIPDHGLSCEMADPQDTAYNMAALSRCNIPAAHAEAIAAAICKMAVAMYDFPGG